MPGVTNEVTFGSKWLLCLLALLHLAAALCHFLISVVSKHVAADIHYGTQACSPDANSTLIHCKGALTQQQCELMEGCGWEWTGLGLDYQLLVGPSFMAVFTVLSIGWGYLADRYNRIHLLVFSSLIFSTAMTFTAFATHFWHLVVLRMILAAGVAGISPIAPGIIYDIFSERHRALAMGFFHWGIYLGGGLSNAVGKTVSDLHIFEQGWRGSFLVSGIASFILGSLMLITGQDPPRKIDEKKKKLEVNASGEESEEVVEFEASEAHVLIQGKQKQKNENNHCCVKPSVILLGIGACIRQAGGYTWGYNGALYFQTNHPEFESSYWLTWITIFGGSLGVVFGGFLSDRLVSRIGLSARALVLAGSQLLAFPFAVGTLWLSPPLAFLSLLLSYLFAEMWYGVVFAMLVELLPSDIRSVGLALALFIINNFGGNVPVLVSPLSTLFGYEGALLLLYPGSLLLSSFLFFVSYLWLVGS